MSSSVASKKKSSSSSIDERESALASCWIRRLCPLDKPPPPPPLPPPHVTAPPRFPLFAGSATLRPLHPNRHQEGPFQVRPGWAQQLTTVRIPDNNNIRESQIKEERETRLRSVGSLRPLDCPPALAATTSAASHTSRRGVYAVGVKNRDEDRPPAPARGNFYNPYAFNFNSTRHLIKERQSYHLPNEPAEESFSYWDMGRLERSNFVSSVYPAASSTVNILDRKRAANTYGFCPPKLRRLNLQ